MPALVHYYGVHTALARAVLWHRRVMGGSSNLVLLYALVRKSSCIASKSDGGGNSRKYSIWSKSSHYFSSERRKNTLHRKVLITRAISCEDMIKLSAEFHPCVNCAERILNRYQWKLQTGRIYVFASSEPLKLDSSANLWSIAGKVCPPQRAWKEIRNTLLAFIYWKLSLM